VARANLLAAHGRHREAIVALRSLAFLPHTQVVIISGRSLSDLAELSGAPEGVHLVGSHGSEFDPGFADRLSDGERQLHARLIANAILLHWFDKLTNHGY